MRVRKRKVLQVAESHDAVIIGAGHNGLVAANLLADAGWDVVVIEAAAWPGGAVQSDELHPGFVTDRFSSFYPMTAASPVMAGLDLEAHGLRWSHAPKVLAHLKADAPAAVLYRDPRRTADLLDQAAPGDGAAWLRIADQWGRIGMPMVGALLAPFPPVRAGLKLGWAGRNDLWDLTRLGVLSVRALAEENFAGVDPGLLLAGNAMHSDVSVDAAPSALLGWLLVGLAQSVGFPVPVGGAAELTRALVARLHATGGEVRTATPALSIEVKEGRATGVATDDGFLAARRAVIAACDAQVLYRRLLDEGDVGESHMARVKRVQRGDATVKIDYALSGTVPWRDDRARDAGTVHIADSFSELTYTGAQLACGELPSAPFVLTGQMTVADQTRSPAGTESLWAYAHVPQDVSGDAAHQIDHRGRLSGTALERFVERMEDRIESHAAGFRDLIVARRVVGPDDMESADPSLIGGDVNGGTAQLFQQLVFRPVPGLGRAETPIRRLFLGSSSAHPGGSVHGACGANAARAALARQRFDQTAKPIVIGGLVAAPGLAALRAWRGSSGD